MSVTFETPAPVLAWAFTCGHPNGVTSHRFTDWAGARDFLVTEMEAYNDHTGHLSVCGHDDCRYGRMMTHAITDNPGPQVTVSNSNAAVVLHAMGLAVPHDSEAIHGTLGLTDFCEALRAGFKAVDTTTSEGQYVYERLNGLTLVAIHAAETGRSVQWC